GYDHLVAVDQLLVDPAGEPRLTALAAELTGVDDPFAEVAWAAKHDVMAGELATEVERAVGLLAEVCAHRRRHSDHTRRELRETIREVAAAMAVYRTYVVPGQAPSPEDRAQVSAALAAAAARRPDLDDELLALLGRVLLLD